MQRRPQGRRVRKTNPSILQDLEKISSRSVLALSLCASGVNTLFRDPAIARWARFRSYPSFAFIEIFAFSTFETGQPFSAASAYF